MDKAEKKRLQQEWRKRERQAFVDSLPMPKELFEKLFDYLDQQLEIQGCNHTIDLTLEFLKNNNAPANKVAQWLREHGGYCDCEVLANVEEHFR